MSVDDAIAVLDEGRRLRTERRSSELEQHSPSLLRWKSLAGFSLLFHGLGSKQDLVNSFVASGDSWMKGAHRLVIRGYSPSTTLKTILTAVCSAVLPPGYTVSLARPQETVDALVAAFSASAAPKLPRLVLVVHNMDGPGLRSDAAQDALAALAAADRIHLIASVDHVLSTALGSSARAAAARWSYVAVPTLAPYVAELDEAPPTLIDTGATLTLDAVSAVLDPVPSIQQTFSILAHAQVSEEDASAGGLTFAAYFAAAQEAMVVSAQHDFNSHLKELTSHRLVKTRRAASGDTNYYIPASPAVLQSIITAYPLEF